MSSDEILTVAQLLLDFGQNMIYPLHLVFCWQAKPQHIVLCPKSSCWLKRNKAVVRLHLGVGGTLCCPAGGVDHRVSAG